MKIEDKMIHLHLNNDGEYKKYHSIIKSEDGLVRLYTDTDKYEIMSSESFLDAHIEYMSNQEANELIEAVDSMYNEYIEYYKLKETIKLKNYTFNKEEGSWYIVLPTWTGPKAALQMVAGADTLLDVLSNNGTTVDISISTDKECPQGFQTLKRIIKTPPNGCMYHLGFSPVWLCDVTKFVFDGKFPKRIHFKTLNN